MLVLPATLFFIVLFVLPVGNMILYSFYQQTPSGDISAEPTLMNYLRFANVDLYRRVLFNTLKVSFLTTIVSMVLSYPIAIAMVRSPPFVARILTIIVVSPLLVNVVIRTYGWRIILANSDQGVLNWVLTTFGLPQASLLYTEWAIIIGCVHVFMPLMVLPLAAALGRIDPAVEEAGRTLGASNWQTFWRVTFPLSIPGLAVGSTLVFSLTASSFVMPALLGGNLSKMLGTLVEEQIMSVFDWPFGAAIATVMVVIVLGINFAYVVLVERRFPTPEHAR